MNSKTVLLIVLVIFVLVSGTIYFTYNKQEKGLYYSIEKSDSIVEQTLMTEDLDIANVDNDTIEPATTVIVQLYGCIQNEGIFELNAGARVYEALEMAGGLKAEASRGYVNQARVLVDGESIFFPSKEEEEEILVVEEIVVDNGLININLAELDLLESLPGIGEAKARSIIAYRTMNGDFTSIEAIMNVSGIKEALFLTIKDMICVL